MDNDIHHSKLTQLIGFLFQINILTKHNLINYFRRLFMKIIDMKIRAYSAPYATPISNGKYTYTSTDIVIATVVTDEGIEGHGWAHGTKLVIDTLESLRARILGEDPFNVERLWDKMYLPKVYGRKGFETRAISAVDIAFWDIMGKAAGRPVRQLLG